MDRLERFYKIDQLLQDHKVVSRYDFLSLLEVSLATFKRDRLNAPVIFDSELRGYCYETQAKSKIGSKFSLPGLWFTEQEIYALITMHHHQIKAITRQIRHLKYHSSLT